MGKEQFEEMDEEMTVELELDDGTNVTCAIITILEVEGKDYIVLMPLDENGRTMTERFGSIVTPRIPMTPTKSLSWTTSMTMQSMKR